jgi:preprotein translocase subunit SecA
MKAFLEMWKRIGLQVTSAIFRLERESPDFVGSLWEVTSATHDEFHEGPAADPQQPPDSGGFAPTQDAGPPQPIKPIRNFGPQVRRNDPCPCGSGKKYKKCCGASPGGS